MIFLCKCVKFIQRILKEKCKKMYLLYNSEIGNIIKSPEKQFKIIRTLNSDSWEPMCLPAIYNISKEIRSSLLYKKQYILDVENALVYDDSNIIVTDKGVIWNKSYHENFTIVVPLDKGLIDYDNNSVRYGKIKNITRVEGKVISLLGVHSRVWSHFLIQYLPKILYAERFGITSEKIMLLVPQYNDIHIKLILEDFVRRNPNIKVIESNCKNSYYCDHLIHIPETAYCGDHANIIHLCDTIIPKETFNLLLASIVNPMINNVRIDKKYKKLYIIRRGTYRSLINCEEVESFFVKEGFLLIEPHKMTLDEKVKAFYSADFIVGPVSAGFTNVMFSRSKTKVLILSSLNRSLDGYTSGFVFHKELDSLRVTGEDSNTTIHSNYYIDINRIEAAYNQLMRNGE